MKPAPLKRIVARLNALPPGSNGTSNATLPQRVDQLHVEHAKRKRERWPLDAKRIAQTLQAKRHVAAKFGAAPNEFLMGMRVRSDFHQSARQHLVTLPH